MHDAIDLLIILVFFGGAALLVNACGRIIGSDPEGLESEADVEAAAAAARESDVRAA